MGVKLSLELVGGFRQDHFESRTDDRLEEMASTGTPVGLSEHGMRMDFRLAVLQSDVAKQRHHFRLLLDWYAEVILFLPIEIAERRPLKCSDGLETGGGEVIANSELFQTGGDFIAAFEDHRPLFGSVINQKP